jgi:hypothetical protein
MREPKEEEEEEEEEEEDIYHLIKDFINIFGVP